MVPVSITKGLLLSFLVRASAPIESESEMDQIFPAVKKLIKKPRSQKRPNDWLSRFRATNHIIPLCHRLF